MPTSAIPAVPDQQAGPTAEELLAGGQAVELEYIDRPRAAIRYVHCLIRLVPVREYPALRAALLDEADLVRIYVRHQNPDTAVELTPAAHELVIREGKRINAHFFDQWLPRRRELEAGMQAPQMSEFLAIAAREFAGQLVPQGRISGATSPTAPRDGEPTSNASGD